MALADAQVRKAALAILGETIERLRSLDLPFEYTMGEKGGGWAFMKNAVYGEDPIPTPQTQRLYAVAYVAVFEDEGTFRGRLAALRPLLGE
jgi:hypothetical protein